MVCRKLAATEELRTAMKIQDTSQQTTPCRASRLQRTRSQPSSERRSSLRRRRSLGGNNRRQHSSDDSVPLSQPQTQIVTRDTVQREVTRRIRMTRSHQRQNHRPQGPVGSSAERQENQHQRLLQGPQGERNSNDVPGRNGLSEEHFQVAQASGVILRVLGDEFNDLYAGTGNTRRPATPSHHR